MFGITMTLGLTMEEGRRIGASGGDFVCPSCHLIQNDSHDASFIVGTPAYLIHVPIFNGGRLVDRDFVTS